MLAVTIVDPESVMFEGTAHSVIFPGEAGVFEVLTAHKNLLSQLVRGKIVVDGKFLNIKAGIVKVESDTITAIVEKEGK